MWRNIYSMGFLRVRFYLESWDFETSVWTQCLRKSNGKRIQTIAHYSLFTDYESFFFLVPSKWFFIPQYAVVFLIIITKSLRINKSFVESLCHWFYMKREQIQMWKTKVRSTTLSVTDCAMLDITNRIISKIKPSSAEIALTIELLWC